MYSKILLIQCPVIRKSDNLALQESSSKTRNFDFLPDKGCMNEMVRSQRQVRRRWRPRMSVVRQVLWFLLLHEVLWQ